VVTSIVAPKAMPIIVEAVGTVQAIASVQLRSRIDSQLMKVHVQEGALVKEGDLLFELDARTLKAQLAQIEAQIRKDKAQVDQAKRDSTRADDLLTKGAGTVVTRDTNVTTQRALEAQLESDEAMRQNILTQISYTEIRAPVSGRIGSIPYKVGTILRVVFNNEDCRVVPIGAMRHRLDHTSDRQVVVGDRGSRTRFSRGCPVGVVIGQIQEDKGRQFRPLALIPRADELAELIQKLVRPQLVGIRGVEIREHWIKVVSQGC